MDIKDFWYVVAQSDELRSDTVLARKILSEWLAVFRDENGKPVVVQDRCKHRSAQLSLGKVENGCLRCPYHGWLYNGDGEVVEVPSEGESLKRMKSRSVQRYACIERDDYIYVRLQESSDESIELINITIDPEFWIHDVGRSTDLLDPLNHTSLMYFVFYKLNVSYLWHTF